MIVCTCGYVFAQGLSDMVAHEDVCPDMKDDEDEQPMPHSTGNPVCPALYGEPCHIVEHNIVQYDPV